MPQPNPPRPALTLAQAARDYGFSPSTLRSAIHARELPAFRIGRRRLRILREDLHAWMRCHPAHKDADDPTFDETKTAKAPHFINRDPPRPLRARDGL
jgi:excisionase family DNA binding protein